MSAFAKELSAIRTREMKLAQAGGLESDAIAGAKGLSETEIAAIEAGLGLKFPATFRAVLATLVPDETGAEFAFARMIFLKSWDEIEQNLGIDEDDLGALKERKLVPIGDDYSGHYWVCLDLARGDDNDCPLVELDLEAGSNGRFDARVKGLAAGVFSGIKVLQDRFEKSM